MVLTSNLMSHLLILNVQVLVYDSVIVYAIVTSGTQRTKDREQVTEDMPTWEEKRTHTDTNKHL